MFFYVGDTSGWALLLCFPGPREGLGGERREFFPDFSSLHVALNMGVCVDGRSISRFGQRSNVLENLDQFTHSLIVFRETRFEFVEGGKGCNTPLRLRVRVRLWLWLRYGYGSCCCCYGFGHDCCERDERGVDLASPGFVKLCQEICVCVCVCVCLCLGLTYESVRRISKPRSFSPCNLSGVCIPPSASGSPQGEGCRVAFFHVLFVRTCLRLFRWGK